MSFEAVLNPQQQAAVQHEDGPAAVYAGPGSGKTRVVALRASRMASAGRRLLVTTFTNDATEEMKSRILPSLPKECAARTQITTLHALCLRILREQGIKFQLLTDENHRRTLAETVGAVELEVGVSGFLSALSFQKNQGVSAASYQPDTSSEDRDFARCWRAYEKEKTKKGLREFDDFILDVASLLDTDETLRALLASRYSHIIVDECQDMNAPQYAVVFALGRDHRNVMLVGDPDQSLYTFRGADTRTFRHFAANPRTRVYELRENYRSARNILAVADSLIRQDTERHPLTMIPTRPEGEPVTWQRYPDPDIEALAVGEQILRLNRSGVKYKEMAVLYRTNAQSEAFERHFTALEIPFMMREEGDFYARKEVRGLLAYLHFFRGQGPVNSDQNHHAAGRPARQSKNNNSPQTTHQPLAADLYPDEWLLALLNIPNRKINKMTGGQLRDHAEIHGGKRIWDILPDFHAADLRSHRALRELRQQLLTIESKLKTISHAGEAIRIIRNATYFDDWLRRDVGGDEQDNDRLQNVQRMQAAAAHYPTIEEYVAAVQKVREEADRRKSERKKKRREQDEVTLGTGHGAKGLEWRCVFAVGWSEEILPHRKAEEIAEERRIAYVIATRARDRLAISSLDSWNESTVAPSRFLTGLSLSTPPPIAEEEEETSSLLPAETTLEPLGGLFL